MDTGPFANNLIHMTENSRQIRQTSSAASGQTVKALYIYGNDYGNRSENLDFSRPIFQGSLNVTETDTNRSAIPITSY